MRDQPAHRPAPWFSASKEELSQLRGVCLDIDETLSTRGKLTAEAFAALWSLKDAGFAVIPITGRPAGWCDHFARFWPVDAVIGENGAFSFFMQQGVRRGIVTPGANPDGPRGNGRLAALAAAIQGRFPHVQWASDQAYREFDLAIDVCEDVPPWPREDIEELLKLCRTAGAQAKLSSVHVNIWFGFFDKRKGLDHWLASGAPGLADDVIGRGGPLRPEQLLFIGDSPNDEPMFASFGFSVGVANLTEYLDRLQSPPRWLTVLESGAGFAEMAVRLVSLTR